MAVRTELVKEFLVGALLDRMTESYPGNPSDWADAALDGVLEQVVGRERAAALPAEVATSARRLARMGYLGRVAETERFDAARARVPELEVRLREAPAEVVSGELARSEPLEKPAPDAERWTSWRVPGPGGHVRHFLAVESILAAFPAGPDGRPRLPQGLTQRELKQCWLYGFYVRCCEESLARESSRPES